MNPNLSIGFRFSSCPKNMNFKAWISLNFIKISPNFHQNFNKNHSYKSSISSTAKPYHNHTTQIESIKIKFVKPYLDLLLQIQLLFELFLKHFFLLKHIKNNFKTLNHQLNELQQHLMKVIFTLNVQEIKDLWPTSQAKQEI